MSEANSVGKVSRRLRCVEAATQAVQKNVPHDIRHACLGLFIQRLFVLGSLCIFAGLSGTNECRTSQSQHRKLDDYTSRSKKDFIPHVGSQWFDRSECSLNLATLSTNGDHHVHSNTGTMASLLNSLGV